MKRLFILLIIFSLVIPLPVFAEQTVHQISEMLQSLSLSELYEVNNALQLSIFEHEASVNGVKVPGGVYIVGQDIPTGIYTIKFIQQFDTDFCTFLATNEELIFGYSTILGFNGASEIGKLELPEGTNVEITGGDVFFYTYTGLFH